MVVAALIGCAEVDEGPTTQPAAPATTSPDESRRPARPSPKAQAALRDPRSAASTVLAYWRYVASGAVLAAHELYDQRVVDGVGEATFGGMLAAQQTYAASQDLNVVDVQVVRRGTVVLAEAVPRSGEKARLSFHLKGGPGRWRIVYDNSTANALFAYVQQREQRRIDADATKPSPAAVAAAEEAVVRFRVIALRLEGTSGATTEATVAER